MKKWKEGTYTKTQFAEFIGRSVPRVHQLVKDEQIKDGLCDDGKIDLIPACREYITTLQNALKAGGSENASITESRARYEKARAEEKELDLALKKGLIVLVEDVRNHWINLLSNFRARMLGIPSKLAAQGEGSNRNDLQKLCEKFIESGLKELSGGEVIGRSSKSDTESADIIGTRKRGRPRGKASAKAKSK